jgi:MFS family permease
MSTSPISASQPEAAGQNSSSRIIFASFIGTAIEFYDFYVYATAAALVIGPVFFPHGSATAQALSAFVTFGIAFVARPIGSFLFGHFGDRIGRKSTLVASLLVMGVSTTLIGFVPGYDSIGSLAPILLCILRFGQGIGLGGEWGGAALLATENAPAGKRGWFGMFPQLGPSVGFLASNGLFFALALSLSDEQFRSWGWRVPFIVSAVLVALGLYVRLKIAETPAFRAAIEREERVRVPIATLAARNTGGRRCSARSRWWSATRCSTSRRFLALVRRLGAAHSASELPRPAVRRGAVHGARHAAFRLGQRPLRPQAGADRRHRRGDPVGLHDGAAARQRFTYRWCCCSS